MPHPTCPALVAAAQGEDGHGAVEVRGWLLWRARYAAVDQQAKWLHCYPNAGASSPWWSLPLEGATVREDVGVTTSSHPYALVVQNKGERIALRCPKSKLQEGLMAAMLASGANLLKQDAHVEAKALFDLGFTDLEGRARSMKEFEGKVCLIVNVASA